VKWIVVVLDVVMVVCREWVWVVWVGRGVNGGVMGGNNYQLAKFKPTWLCP